MSTAVTRIESKRPMIGWTIGAVALAAAAIFAASPARADNDKHRGGHGYYHGGHPGKHHGHHKRHGHGHSYWSGPVYYAPPPVYYVPPRPVYYHPPQPSGLTVVIPLHFD